MPTPLPRYYTDSTCYELATAIEQLEVRDGLVCVVLNDTIFHPQGGGQPSDRGTLESSNGLMEVQQVKKREDGSIEHRGSMISGTFAVGDTVTCNIDRSARQLHSRLHSAGHLLDVALEKLGYHWEAGKSYHFVDGPYVEYQTDEVPNPDLAARLEAAAAELIEANIPTNIELHGTRRIVTLANKPIPCGGTHVQTTGEISTFNVRSIKSKHGMLRVSYELS